MDETNLPGVSEAPDEGITKDLIDLPSGSAVLQLVLHRIDGEPGMAHLETRMVMIGATELDMSNPAHRVAVVLQRYLPQILEEALQATPVEQTPQEMADKIHEAAAQAHLDAHKDVELLSDKPVDTAQAHLDTHSDAELLNPLGTMAPLADLHPENDDGLRIFDAGNKLQ
jgi:hypothetical protein